MFVCFFSFYLKNSVAVNYFVPAAGIEFDKINQEDALTTFQRYAISKLANILFTNSLANRLENKEIYVNSLHPGIFYNMK